MFAEIKCLLDDSSSSRSVIDKIDQVAALTDDKLIRFSMLASQVARFVDHVLPAGKNSAVDSMETILSLNGIRDPNNHEQFLGACEVVLTVVSRDKNSVERSIFLLRECRERINRTDVKSIVERLPGVELRDAVKSAYSDQVADLLENDLTTQKRK